MPKTKPWEQQPDESNVAFQAFRTFRDLGAQRSIQQAAEMTETPLGTIYTWSSQHQWVRRAREWDMELEREYLAELKKARRNMNQRHARLGSAFLAQVTQRLLSIDPNSLTPTEAIRWLEVATKVERQAYGEPDKHEISGPEGGPVQITQLTPEERREWLEKANREIALRLEEMRAGQEERDEES